MTSKMKKTKVCNRNRNWTNEEVVLFAKIDSDPNETFIQTLEKKALKIPQIMRVLKKYETTLCIRCKKAILLKRTKIIFSKNMIH